MLDDVYLQKETEYLFGCDYFSDDFDPEGTERENEHQNRAEALLKKYPWNAILTSWSNYLHQKCSTEEDVINFCNLFFIYGGSEQLIPDPYRFCAYLYYRIDVIKMLQEGQDAVFYLIESIALNILQKAHCVSLVEDPYYAPERDPKIIEQIKYWQRVEG